MIHEGVSLLRKRPKGFPIALWKPSATIQECGLLRIISIKERFTAAEEGITVEHDDAAAAVALHLDIRAGAGDGPGVAAAGMGLF